MRSEAIISVEKFSPSSQFSGWMIKKATTNPRSKVWDKELASIVIFFKTKKVPTILVATAISISTNIWISSEASSPVNSSPVKSLRKKSAKKEKKSVPRVRIADHNPSLLGIGW